MNVNDYTASNRHSWDAAAAALSQQTFAQLKRKFSQPDFNCLDRVEKRILQTLGIEGKVVAHPCCNNGRELLSIQGMGASYGVGFDISSVFVEQAQALADHSGRNCRFVCTDVYNIPAYYNGMFDLVYISVGTLGWMPDLDAFCAVLSRLLKANGDLFIYEMHPILDMFEPTDTADPPTLHHSYFRHDPYVEYSGADQQDMRYEPAYFWFHHKLSDILGGCINHGLQLTSIQEYGHDVSGGFAPYEESSIRLPLSYTLTARKK